MNQLKPKGERTMKVSNCLTPRNSPNETPQSLKHLDSKTLLSTVKNLTQRERALTVQIIDYLTEISRRKAFLPKYTSLFTFMVEELGYCPSTAALRINAIKAFTAVPEIRTKVIENEVSLNAVTKTQSFINDENRTAKEQNNAPLTPLEQAELFAAIESTPSVDLQNTLHKKKHEIDTRKAQSAGLPPPPPKPQTKKVSIEVDSELEAMMDELKSLLSHCHPGAPLAILLKKALPLAIGELKISKGLVKRSDLYKNNFNKKDTQKQKGREFKGADREIGRVAGNESDIPGKVGKENITSLSSEIGESTRSHKLGEAGAISNKPSLKPSIQAKVGVGEEARKSEKRDQSQCQWNIVTRAIPLPIKQKVWARDRGCCQHLDSKSQKICGSRHQIQLDHIKPWSLGGEHSVENIRLLCGVHNRYRVGIPFNK